MGELLYIVDLYYSVNNINFTFLNLSRHIKPFSSLSAYPSLVLLANINALYQRNQKTDWIKLNLHMLTKSQNQILY